MNSRLHAILVCSAALLHAAGAADQQKGYPDRALTMIVPIATGGTGDIFCRMVATGLSERFGQPVVVDNKPGAATAIGMTLLQNAAPDGYTFAYVGNNTPTYHLTNKNPRYVFMRDFQPITVAAEGALGLVVNADKVKAATVQEFIAQARANPGKLNYASSGVGTPAHMTAEWLQSITGTKLAHIPYKGSPQATTAVTAGEVDMMFLSPNAFTPHVKAGKLRALAVTSGKRSAMAPTVPTLKDSGIDLIYTFWFGFAAPLKTPRDVVMKLSSEISSIVQRNDVKDKLLTLGVEPLGNTPEEFAVMARREIDITEKLMKEIGLQPE